MNRKRAGAADQSRVRQTPRSEGSGRDAPALSYRSSKTEIRSSPIHGKTLFARQAIGSGEILAVKGGHVLTAKVWETLEPELDYGEIQIAEDLFVSPVDAARREGSMLSTNHSCDPNIALPGEDRVRRHARDRAG